MSEGFIDVVERHRTPTMDDEKGKPWCLAIACFRLLKTAENLLIPAVKSSDRWQARTRAAARAA